MSIATKRGDAGQTGLAAGAYSAQVSTLFRTAATPWREPSHGAKSLTPGVTGMFS
jgi:hypothetical protein